MDRRKKIAASPFRKEFKRVKDHAEGLGWRTKETTKGWQFLAPPDKVQPGYKGIVTTHGSPSDHRAFKNFLGDLRNEGGLVWPPERARQLEKKQVTELQLQHDPKDCLRARGIDSKGLSDDDVYELDQMAHDDEHGAA